MACTYKPYLVESFPSNRNIFIAADMYKCCPGTSTLRLLLSGVEHIKATLRQAVNSGSFRTQAGLANKAIDQWRFMWMFVFTTVSWAPQVSSGYNILARSGDFCDKQSVPSPPCPLTTSCQPQFKPYGTLMPLCCHQHLLKNLQRYMWLIWLQFKFSTIWANDIRDRNQLRAGQQHF